MKIKVVTLHHVFVLKVDSYVYMCIYTRICVYVYICMYMYVHTHIHTPTYATSACSENCSDAQANKAHSFSLLSYNTSFKYGAKFINFLLCFTKLKLFSI